MKQIELVEGPHLKKDIPKFKPGDTLRVYVKIKEGDKTRTQEFAGTVLRTRGRGLNSTFTVRKVSYAEGVERTFLLHSPLIEKIAVEKAARARRAKLYYLSARKGKKSKVAARLQAT